MQGSPVVALERVSKRYLLRRRAANLKERLIGGIAGRRDRSEILWALRDVSLEIRRGETIGIIGPNGCGKSTLLQIVAGILVPDEGRATTTGRVTSLLELGAGFSPDLSGRENVFLNASLHGFSRDTVARRFGEIVAFAELERFIDTPVRNYSSGMYVRLGFAVAVHLDPEIVLVDEALAVGDENFQRKCLRRLKEFQQRGVTIVLVSHDLALVEQFCERVCLLRQGTVETIGAPAEALARYHQLAASDEESPEAGRWGTRAVEILGVEFLSRSGESTGTVRTRDPLTIRLRYRAPQPVDRPVFGLAIHRDNGVHVTGPNTRMSGFEIESVAGTGVLDYEIARVPLLPGRYLISAAVYDHDLITPYDHRDRFRSLIVLEGGTDERFGTIELSGRWSFPETARAVRPSEAGTMVADA